MADEPFSNNTSNSTTSHSPSPDAEAEADSHIGKFLSVTSKSEIRYEGILYHLNLKDSTLGLKNARSYGTEGRNVSGPQVPPSDQVYQYIMFRVSDIKDLQVKKQEPLHYDPAIIQTNYNGEPSTSSNLVSASTGSSTDPKNYSERPAINAISYPILLPPHSSGTQLGIRDSAPSTNSVISSSSMPTQWQGYYAVPPGSITGDLQHSVSTTTLYPVQNQSSTAFEVSNVSNNLFQGHSLATPSSIYLSAAPTHTSEQLSIPFTNSFNSMLSFPFHHSTVGNTNGLAIPFPVTYQSSSNNKPSVFNEVGPDPVSSLYPRPSPYSTLSVPDSISEPMLMQQPPFLTPNQLSQPKLSEYSTGNNLYADQNGVSADFSSSATISAVQPPLLPLPPASQKLQYPSKYIDEEFDFQAMNEKFNKDEVWGYLGKSSQRDKIERVQEGGSSSQDLGYANPTLESKIELKPSYNKDDFFDTISCNSAGRGARNGQNRGSERIKLDSETFGNFQHRNQLGYNGYGAGRGRGPFNRGRGYNYGRSRGRRGSMS